MPIRKQWRPAKTQNERIRYLKIGERLESVRVFSHPKNGARYRVIINTTKLQWLVIDNYSELVAASGPFHTVAKAQRAVKKALTALGVILLVEKRRERTQARSVG